MVKRASRAWAWIRGHPVTADAALVAALLGAGLLSAHVELENRQLGDPAYRSPSTAAVVIAASAMIVPLALRRLAPLSALLACTAGFLLSRIALDAGDATITAIVLSLAVYSAAAHGCARWRHWVCGTCLVAVMAESGAKWSSTSRPSCRTSC